MDFEKTMQFLLEQQARFDARQAEFVEQQLQSQERMTRIEGVLLDVATAQAGTNSILATLAERHVELAQSHKELYEAQRVTEQSHKALYDAQRVTEHNVNALISAVEQHIASHS